MTPSNKPLPMTGARNEAKQCRERVEDVVVDDAFVHFVVAVAGPAADAPRVSVRCAPGGNGAVDVIGVEERVRSADGHRVVVFVCEAERNTKPFAVTVLVDRPGSAPIHLPGPLVPAVPRR